MLQGFCAFTGQLALYFVTGVAGCSKKFVAVKPPQNLASYLPVVSLFE